MRLWFMYILRYAGLSGDSTWTDRNRINFIDETQKPLIQLVFSRGYEALVSRIQMAQISIGPITFSRFHTHAPPEDEKLNSQSLVKTRILRFVQRCFVHCERPEGPPKPTSWAKTVSKWKTRTKARRLVYFSFIFRVFLSIKTADSFMLPCCFCWRFQY